MPQHLFVSTSHFDGPTLYNDIILTCFKHMRGDLLDLSFHFIHRFDNCGHAYSTGSGAISTHTKLHFIGVAMNNLDVFRRQIKTLRHNLRKCGFMSLPMAVRASENFDRTHGIDSDFSTFPEAHASPETSHCR